MFQALSRAPSSGNKRKRTRKSDCPQGVYQLWEKGRPMHDAMAVSINLPRIMAGSSEINPGRTVLISFKEAGEL